jgi:hypothetical protein
MTGCASRQQVLNCQTSYLGAYIFKVFGPGSPVLKCQPLNQRDRPKATKLFLKAGASLLLRGRNDVAEKLACELWRKPPLGGHEGHEAMSH